MSKQVLTHRSKPSVHFQLDNTNPLDFSTFDNLQIVKSTTTEGGITIYRACVGDQAVGFQIGGPDLVENLIQANYIQSYSTEYKDKQGNPLLNRSLALPAETIEGVLQNFSDAICRKIHQGVVHIFGNKFAGWSYDQLLEQGRSDLATSNTTGIRELYMRVRNNTTFYDLEIDGTEVAAHDMPSPTKNFSFDGMISCVPEIFCKVVDGKPIWNLHIIASMVYVTSQRKSIPVVERIEVAPGFNIQFTGASRPAEEDSGEAEAEELEQETQPRKRARVPFNPPTSA